MEELEKIPVKELLGSMSKDQRDELFSYLCGPRKKSWSRTRREIIQASDPLHTEESHL